MRRPVSHSIALSAGLGRKNPVTPGDLRPEKVPWKWEPPSPTSPEVGAGLTEVGWRLGTRTFGARSETPTDRCPPGPRKPASLLGPSQLPRAGLTPALSWQSLTAALAVRRFKDLTFQEEYSTLFPASAQP